jgi:methionine salvage enolase-phosphatase E1
VLIRIKIDTKFDLIDLKNLFSEAIAAKSVGINTLLSVREGNEPLTQEDMKHFQFVSSFDEIQFK